MGAPKGKIRVKAWLTPQEHHRLAMAAAMDGVPMTRLMIRAITREVERVERRYRKGAAA